MYDIAHTDQRKLYKEIELKDLSLMNEFDNHIEHSKIYENYLEKRAKEKTISIEDDFAQKATFEEFKKAIEMLTEIQKKRIKNIILNTWNRLK